LSSAREAEERRHSTVVEYSLDSNVHTEAEESPLLEAVAKECLVKTQQAGKGLAGAVVICKVWRLAVAL
jgi:hypothetical protein